MAHGWSLFSLSCSQNAKWGSVLMWGGSVCRDLLGPPVSLWTTGTVGQQFVFVSPLCEVCVSNIICVIVSLSL